MSAALPSFGSATVEAHPLLRRLSGQVIWLLLEERGVDEAAIGAFLDRWNERRAGALEALERFMAPEARGGMRILARNEGNKAACPRCAALDGLVIPAGHPSLAALSPPYAVNCPARTEVLEPDDPAMKQALAMDDPGPASPHGDLLCPYAPTGSDWPE